MSNNYLKVIGEFYPSAVVQLTGGPDPTVYSNLTWTTTAIAQATLDSIAIKSSWPQIEAYGPLVDDTPNPVINNTASIIAAGVPVYSVGTDSTTGRMLISASDSAVAASLPIVGITVASVPASGYGGIICSDGQMRGVINTSTYNAGDTLYVASGGGITNVKPSTLQYQIIGTVITVGNPGVIFVRLQTVVPRAPQKSIDIPIYGASALDYRSSTATTYTSMCRFIFRGTNNYSTPTNIKVVTWVSSASYHSNVRLYDITNSQVIATSANITSTSNTIVDLGTITNVPASDAILEFQIMTSSTSCTAYMSSGHIYFF